MSSAACLNFLHPRYKKDLLGAFRNLQALGYVEIITSAATHAYLPLVSINKSAVRAQITLGVAHYRQVFEQPPAGFWLPECGYFPGVDSLLIAASPKMRSRCQGFLTGKGRSIYQFLLPSG